MQPWTGDMTEDTTPPTLVIYTITNTTIIPPQTTEIDVEFSEQVSAVITIEDTRSSLITKLYTNFSVTNPDPTTWNGTYTNGTTVPDGVYTVNVTATNTTTGLNVINTSETITVTLQHAVARICGDLNGDGVVDMGDVIILLNHVGDPDKYKLGCCGG